MKKFFVIGSLVTVLLVSLYFWRFRMSKAPKETEKEEWNVILISIDTIRPDYLQLYEPGGAPTPNLNRIAEKAHLFTQAIAQVPYTLPSHCTMLTGTYPMKHQVQDNIESKLSNESVTLAEILKQNGYSTAGFVASVVLSQDTGIHQGFDFYDDSFSGQDIKSDDAGGIQKQAGVVYKSFLRWYKNRSPDKFFAFIHFYDPHTPYEPPAPFLPDSKTESELYKGELRYVDSIIGKLYDDLSQSQGWSNTVLIITGDHGEMLNAHGEETHGYFVYQEAVKVPLLIATPGQSKNVLVKGVVQLVDLVPTILELLSITGPESIQGESFVNLMGGKTDSRYAYAESTTALRYFGASPFRSIQDQRYKFILSPRSELYDTVADPQEQNNLSQKETQIAERLKARLSDALSRYGATTPASDRPLSDEDADKLAALGYIQPGKSNVETNLSRDGKDFIQSWTDLNQITTLLQKEKFSEVLVLIDRIQKTGPVATDLRIYEARAREGLGMPQESIRLLQRVLVDEPENKQALMALAHSFRTTGKIEEAVSIYQKLIEKDISLAEFENYSRLLLLLNRKQELKTQLEHMKAQNKFSDRHNELLGEIYLNLGEFAEARHYLQKAMKSSPDSPFPYIHYSALLAAEGKLSEAIALMEQNSQRFLQADFLLQMGRLYGLARQPQREVDTFQKMVQLYPKDSRGYFFLARILLEHHGDPRTVIQLAEKGLSLQPSKQFEPFGLFLIGDAYTAMGMKDKAKPYLSRAEQLEAQRKNAKR